MLGALNAITHELVMVTNDTYITADSVCELLRRIAKLNLGMPITLVLDNARYTEVQYRDRIGFAAQYRAALSPRLFTQLKPHRKALEIR